jgi:5-methylcytosine-specific restriction endonuclease McrBC GTP-binding regulatory subunit McrB
MRVIWPFPSFNATAMSALMGRRRQKGSYLKTEKFLAGMQSIYIRQTRQTVDPSVILKVYKWLF